MNKTRSLCLVLAPLLLAGACGDQPDPAFRLKSLRVLGVHHQPVWPAPGETSVLTPFVYTPPETSPPTYQWSWCPWAGSSQDGYPCQLSAEELAAQGTTGVPPEDLGTEATAAFPYSIDPALLAQACAGGFPGSPAGLDCRFGFGATIKMTIKTEAKADQIDVVDTVRLPFDATTAVNTNPMVGGLVAVIDGVDTPIDETAQVTIPRDHKTEIKLAIPAQAVDAYPDPRLAICPTATAPLHEALSLSWFVECGDLENQQTGYREAINSLEDAGRNKWLPGLRKDCDQEAARLIVVARDARQVLPSTLDIEDPCAARTSNRLTGGIAWTSATVRLGDAL
jgi:hypothetical protein